MATADALELLSQELSHRIKNIFAVVGGLVSLSSRNHPAASEFAQDLYSRILALGRAHAFIGSPGSRSDEAARDGLKGLLAELLLPYRSNDPTRIVISGEDIAVDDRSATPLALVFHELATNSAKYGAIASEHGSIEINLQAGETAKLQWLENGVDLHGPERVSGFGSRLIEMSIVRQLGGSFSREWHGDTLRIDINIPNRNLRRE